MASVTVDGKKDQVPYDEPLTLAVCPSCSTVVYRWKVGGIEWTADLTAVDAQKALRARLAGHRLYRIRFMGGRPLGARPADTRILSALATAPPEERPHVVAAHPCTAVSRPIDTTPGPSVQGTPPKPPAGRTAPFPGPQGAPSSVRGAGPTRSDGPECSECGLPCADGTYASVDIGDLTLWAAHVVGNCTEDGRSEQ